MTSFSEWLGASALIALVILIPFAVRGSKKAWERKMAKALRWVARYYTDEKTRDVAARFALILEAQINVPLDRFTPQTNFLDDLGMDDLEPVEVLMAIEEEFRISPVDETEAQKMCVFDDVVRYLVAR